MKLLYLLICIFLFGLSNGQKGLQDGKNPDGLDNKLSTAQYQPILNDTKVEIFYLGEVNDAILRSLILIEGDTTIGGFNYKIAYYGNPEFDWDRNEFGYVREEPESGKLWFRGMNGGREDLVMNLNLEVSDSFYIPLNSNGGRCSDQHFQVSKVETINGRKIVTIDTPEDCYIDDLQFIEGVGTNNTILYTLSQSDNLAFNYSLCSVYHSDTLTYQRIPEEDCQNYYFINTSQAEVKTQAFELYPSIIQDFLQIRFKGNHLPNDLKISFFDLVGKIISEHTINSIEQDINLTNLTAGTIIYHISKKDRLLQSGKLIKD